MLALQLFGNVQIRWEGVSLKFATEHTRALLAYLAAEADVSHQRTTVAALLWPEDHEEKARRNLRQALFFLKQTLIVVPHRDEILQITPTSLRWHGQDVEVDLQIFQQSWQLGQTHNHTTLHECSHCLDGFARAITFYRGEFLAGLSLKGNQPFEEWALFLREQCHRQVMTMLDALTSYHLATGASAEQAADYAARQVALEPWHEEGHRQLMQALAAQGQQGAALRQYESCRRILQQELGVPPAPETTKLYEQIRTGKLAGAKRGQNTPAAPPPVRANPSPTLRHNLPTTLAPLIGRSQQLEQLLSLMGGKEQRLITIVGMGGMGKSRLALALLEQLLADPVPSFAYGTWFIPVRGVSTQADNLADALASATLKALGITPATQDDLSHALFHTVAQRQLLLVFDSFEYLLVEEESAIAATEFLLGLLQAVPGASVVITSRLPLRLLAETVIRLEGLNVPPASAEAIDRRDLANYESVRLFLYHARRTLPDFALRDEHLLIVIELCRMLGGMPLAIELAAALMPHFAPHELATAIRQNLALLVSQRRDLDVRHRHFRAVLESSWQLLSAREQTILAQCSVFVGNFSRSAAQEITGATVGELASLVDKSLLQQPGIGVYHLHDLLRQFAVEQLSASQQAVQAVAERHSSFYLNFVAEREQMLTRRQPRQALQEIQQEVDNVRQAWAWAITHIGEAHLTAKLYTRLDASAYALWQFYLIASLFIESVTVFQQAGATLKATLDLLSAAETLAEETLRRGQQLLSKLLALEAFMLSSYGDHTRAPLVAQQAIALGLACGSNAGEVIGLLAITQAHYYNGAFEKAQAGAAQLLQRVQALQWNDKPPEFYYDVQFLLYLYLGVIALNTDRYEQARKLLTEALQICQSIGKLRSQLHAQVNLANLSRYKLNYAAARQDYERSLQIALELGYRRGEALVRYELADVLRGLGDYSGALEQFTRSLTVLREIDEPFHENYAQVDIGRLYAYMGDFQKAHELIFETLGRSENFTMLDAKLDTWLATSLLYGLTGEAGAALDYATRCHQLARQQNNRRYEGFALLYQGRAFVALGHWPEANAAYANALAIYQQLQIPPIVAEAQIGLADVALAQGDLVAALVWVEKSLAILAEHRTVGLDEPFQFYLTCYRVLTANHDPRNLAILTRGTEELFRYANHIIDSDLRHSFLTNVPTHRALHQLYLALGNSDA